MNKIYMYLTLCWLISASSLYGNSHDQKMILVVGGAGFIGSNVNEMLYKCGYHTIVLDDLSQGNSQAVLHGLFIKGNCGDSDLLNEIFSTYPIDAVMHFAAFTDVGESVTNPLKYYKNNVSNTITLLDAMHRHRINVFIFSSSAAIYGYPQAHYITEDHPHQPMNPYGQSKLIIETILPDLEKAYGLKYCCLRYFNAAGGDPDGNIKNYKTKAQNLIPIILQKVLEGKGVITIFGDDYPTKDGTCIRDYIHVADLSTAHIAAMERLFNGGYSGSYNLGNGAGYSVKEVIEAVEAVTGLPVPYVVGPRRPGDPPYLIASSKKAKQELGWQPQHPALEEIIEHAWNSMKNLSN